MFTGGMGFVTLKLLTRGEREREREGKAGMQVVQDDTV